LKQRIPPFSMDQHRQIFLQYLETPLHYACVGGRHEMIQLLIEKGGSLESVSQVCSFNVWGFVAIVYTTIIFSPFTVKRLYPSALCCAKKWR
jgi:hypothetical protein